MESTVNWKNNPPRMENAVNWKSNPPRRLLSAKDLQKMGFSRCAAYALLNRSDLPVIRIGDRKFMHADLFDQWLEDQARHGAETQAE